MQSARNQRARRSAVVMLPTVGDRLPASAVLSAGHSANPFAHSKHSDPPVIDPSNRHKQGISMNKQLTFKLSLVMAGLLALPLAQASNMSKADYNTAKARISTGYKAERSACASLAANAKDICIEEASAKQKVARAELEYGYSGKPDDQTKVMVAKAEAAYAVAKEKCDDQAGNSKDVCVKQAKAVEVKALADAKMGQQIGEAKVDASDAKRDADYKVAVEKCDAMAGDAKASCLSAAKVSFGKS
jgi:hypothetical protein